MPLLARAVVGHRVLVLVAEGTSIDHSDRQARTGTRKMRTMIKRSTKTMRARMMRMKSTIVKIIEDDT